MNQLLPNSIKGVTPYVNPAPIGIQNFINAAQTVLGQLTYNTSFGEAETMVKIDSNGNNVTYPAGFNENYDSLSLIGLDDFACYTFLVPRDSARVINDFNKYYNDWEQKIDLIAWFNLNAIDAADKTNFKARIRKEIRDTLVNVSYDYILGFEILSEYVEPKNIFKGFDVNYFERQLFSYPYAGVRFELKVMYTDKEGC